MTPPSPDIKCPKCGYSLSNHLRSGCCVPGCNCDRTWHYDKNVSVEEERIHKLESSNSELSSFLSRIGQAVYYGGGDDKEKLRSIVAILQQWSKSSSTSGVPVAQPPLPLEQIKGGEGPSTL